METPSLLEGMPEDLGSFSPSSLDLGLDTPTSFDEDGHIDRLWEDHGEVFMMVDHSGGDGQLSVVRTYMAKEVADGAGSLVATNPNENVEIGASDWPSKLPAVDVTSPVSRTRARSNEDLLGVEKEEIFTEEKTEDVLCSPKPKRRRYAHKEHSKRYRMNVGSKFSELSALIEDLDQDSNCKSSSKSQILHQSIKLVADYRKKISSLSVQLAMSSRKKLLEWVDETVENSNSLYDALCPLMNLLCSRRSWKYAEVWMPNKSGKEVVMSLKGAYMSSTEGDLGNCMKAFHKYSEMYTFRFGEGLIGRVYESLRAETVLNPSESQGFLRSDLAFRHGVNAFFGVPVVVNGSCEAVIAFCDTDQRLGDSESINLANSIVTYIGNAFGAKLAKKSREKSC